MIVHKKGLFTRTKRQGKGTIEEEACLLPSTLRRFREGQGEKEPISMEAEAHAAALCWVCRIATARNPHEFHLNELDSPQHVGVRKNGKVEKSRLAWK